MTPDEYAGAILANRIFGRQQVRQKTRALAAEFGLDPALLDPQPRPRRPLRLTPDTWADDAAAVRRSWLMEQYVAARVLRPAAHVVITNVA